MKYVFKTVLLTIITLSVLVIAVIELTGISSNSFFNKSEAAPHYDDQPQISIKPLDEKEDYKHDLPVTTIEFDSEKYDFGKVKEGQLVNHTFVFKNSGNNPLTIKNVIATCGCTIPKFTKSPILPGGVGEVAVEFNSKGRSGLINKKVLVLSNTPEEMIALNFTAEIVK